ncbi:MAG: hypothetical protein IPN18_13130 [Ignavibacteriales bacterium]|nr:hypothetical protein [Ignavibacteriales bacterium]
MRVSQFVLRSTGYQFITADRKGRIHVVWSDGKIEPGSVQEVYYSRSTDGGTTDAPTDVKQQRRAALCLSRGDLNGTTQIPSPLPGATALQSKTGMHLAVSTDGV